MNMKVVVAVVEMMMMSKPALDDLAQGNCWKLSLSRGTRQSKALLKVFMWLSIYSFVAASSFAHSTGFVSSSSMPHRSSTNHPSKNMKVTPRKSFKDYGSTNLG